MASQALRILELPRTNFSGPEPACYALDQSRLPYVGLELIAQFALSHFARMADCGGARSVEESDGSARWVLADASIEPLADNPSALPCAPGRSRHSPRRFRPRPCDDARRITVTLQAGQGAGVVQSRSLG